MAPAPTRPGGGTADRRRRAHARRRARRQPIRAAPRVLRRHTRHARDTAATARGRGTGHPDLRRRRSAVRTARRARAARRRDSGRRTRRGLGRARRAEARSLHGAARREPRRIVAWRRRRFRLPLRSEGARAALDAADGARVGSPARERAAPARRPLPAHEQRVRRARGPRPAPRARMSFTIRLGCALECAHVDYAVLVDGDNDLDLVVAPGSMRIVQEVLSRFGPIVQAHDYEVPYSRLLVVRLPDGPRYRRVDVACDPNGIGKYGGAPAAALAAATTDEEGVRRPNAAALFAYLAVKRARKGVAAQSADELADVAARAGDDGRASLRALAGTAADQVCDALASGPLPTLERALECVARAIDADLRQPTAVAARAYHEARRTLRRLARP